jgi:hypothetical protein
MNITPPASADSLPSRKPGLWEISISTEIQGDSHPVKMKQCTDEAADAKLMQAGNDIQGQSMCSKNEITKTEQGYSISSICTHAGSKVSSEGAFTGDFSSEYSGDITTSFDPPVFGQKESKTTIRAKWLGACSDDMRPGDMILPNGMKMNVDKAAQSAKQAAKMLNNPEIAHAIQQMPKGLNKEMESAMKEMMQQMGTEE